MRQTIYAVAILIGMIVGVGIFGVPYVTVKAGLLAGIFWILVLGASSLLVSLFYSEVVLAVPEKHRLVGYASHYFGKFGKYFVALVNILSFWGAQIAYIIVGGKFLHLLVGKFFGGTEFAYNIVFFAVMALFILGGLRLVESVELSMTALLIFTVLSIFVWGAPRIDWQNFTPLNLPEFFFPYGVILFALGGAAAIPEMGDILSRNRRKFKIAIVVGSLIAILLTLLFVFSIVGTTGERTTPEALEGLGKISGNGFIVLLGLFFGILAITTSFLVLGLNLREVFQYDYRLKRLVSWFLAVCIPFLFFLAGAKNFIRVIDFTGSIFGGLEGIIIVSLFLRIFSLRETTLKSLVWKTLAFVLIVIFLAGMVAKVIHIF